MQAQTKLMQAARLELLIAYLRVITTQNPNSRLVYMTVRMTAFQSSISLSLLLILRMQKNRLKGFSTNIIARPKVVAKMKRKAVPKQRERQAFSNPRSSKLAMQQVAPPSSPTYGKSCVHPCQLQVAFSFASCNCSSSSKDLRRVSSEKSGSLQRSLNSFQRIPCTNDLSEIDS